MEHFCVKKHGCGKGYGAMSAEVSRKEWDIPTQQKKLEKKLFAVGLRTQRQCPDEYNQHLCACKTFVSMD